VPGKSLAHRPADPHGRRTSGLVKEENENTLQTRARQEIMLLERGLVVLEIVVGIAPLLGLVGRFTE